jgi:predicted nuclease with RNAse H fold
VKTLGIDLSSMPKGTAACSITWKKREAVVEPPVHGCDDQQLDLLVRESDAVGIDAPLGWPEPFVNAVSEWTWREWDESIRDRLRFRETDRHIREKLGLRPLSVSSDRIALPAMRAMALLKRHGITDRSGDGRFFEVYPAGSLATWKLPSKNYKKENNGGLAVRRSILRGLRDRLPWLQVSERYAESADDLDSLIASQAVRAAAQGLAHGPAEGQSIAARREGWIHLSEQLPSL